jgi:hypothetical protein
VGISARRTRKHLRAVFDREVSGKGSGTHTVILRAEEAAGNMLHAGFRQRPCDRAIIQASDSLSSLILKGMDKKIKQTQYF